MRSLQSRVISVIIICSAAFLHRSAQASLTIDLQITSINGKPALDSKVAVGSNMIPFRQRNVISIDIIAKVRGANTSTANDGFKTAIGSIVSIGGSIKGSIVPNGDEILDAEGNPAGRVFAVSPFADSGTQNGVHQDLNGDGIL